MPSARRRPTDIDAASPNMTLPWRSIAFGATAVGLVSLASLVVVASLHHSETLATVALSLAVFAFFVQIIVFLGQSAAQTAQTARSEDLYGRTLELLADIRESSRHTQEAVKEQRELLLPALLAKVDLQRPPGPSQPDYTRAAEDIEAVYPPREPSEDDARIATELSTWPRDRDLAQATATDLQSLSANAVEFLARFAQDEWFVCSHRASISNGLYLARNTPWTRELLAHGLLRPLDPPLIDQRDSAREFFVLTDKGRQYGRVLIAPEPKPPELDGLEFPRPELDVEMPS